LKEEIGEKRAEEEEYKEEWSQNLKKREQKEDWKKSSRIKLEA
jgi:hypothetical protein